jgi:predicted ATPase
MDGVLDSPGFPEDIFRTIVILWWLLDSDSLLLLEDPETCLDAASLSRLPMLMSRLQVLRKTSRQILISTHSRDLLDAPDLRTGEIVTLHLSADGPAVSAFMGLSGMTGLPSSGEGPADDSEPMFTIS